MNHLTTLLIFANTKRQSVTSSAPAIPFTSRSAVVENLSRRKNIGVGVRNIGFGL